MLRGVQQGFPELGLSHRYHDKKVKKLAFDIARNAKSTSKGTQRKVKRTYRALIDRVHWLTAISEERQQRMPLVFFDAPELEHYTPLVERIIDQAERRVFNGAVVPATGKIFSLFKEDTELLIRGKAGKKVEFGHMVSIAQTGEKSMECIVGAQKQAHPHETVRISFRRAQFALHKAFATTQEARRMAIEKLKGTDLPVGTEMRLPVEVVVTQYVDVEVGQDADGNKVHTLS